MHKPQYINESEIDGMEPATLGLWAVLGILTIVPMMLLNGFVLEKLWGWFIVDLGAPDISVGQAIGISLVAGFLAHQYNRWTSIYPYSYYVYAIIMPLSIWGIGWAVHAAM